MSIIGTKASTFTMRSVLPFLWVLGVSGVVGWAGCGSTVVTGGGSTGDSTSTGGGSTGNTSSTSSSSSSGTPVTCNSYDPNCPYDIPSPGSPCDTPGQCCSVDMCDHMGGDDVTNFMCNDAGTWDWL